MDPIKRKETLEGIYDTLSRNAEQCKDVANELLGGMKDADAVSDESRMVLAGLYMTAASISSSTAALVGIHLLDES